MSNPSKANQKVVYDGSEVELLYTYLEESKWIYPPKYSVNHFQKLEIFYLGKMKVSASVNERTTTYLY